MKTHYTIIFLLAFIVSHDIWSQEKMERESRLKSEHVPETAKSLISQISDKKRLKWYLEEGLQRKSVEAKFISAKKKYSAEFTVDGKLEDLEIEVNWKTIPKKTKEKINEVLSTKCRSYSIRKVQEQYSAQEATKAVKNKTLASLIHNPNRYELVVKCTNLNSTELMEYLISKSGALVSETKIIFKSATNLEY